MAGVSVLDKVVDHERASLDQARPGKKKSHNLVGEHSQLILEEMVTAANPFGRRERKVMFTEQVRGSPYGGLKLSEVERFVKRTKKTYSDKY